MRWYKLDEIIREALADREFPLHFYVPFLHLGTTAVREIHFMARIAQRGLKVERLPIDQDDYSANLPDDYVDYVVIGKEYKNKVQPFGIKDSLSQLVGQFTSSYPVEEEDDMIDQFSFLTYLADPEYMGGQYGWGNGIMPNSFRVIPQMNKIQFDPGVGVSEVYMEYISEGIEVNSTTYVHPFAVRPIKDFIFWKYKDRSKRYNRLEVAKQEDEFYASLRILRAKMDKLTPVDITRAKRKSYRRTYKT